MIHLLYKDLYLTRKTILLYLLIGLLLQFNPSITPIFIFFITYGVLAKTELTEEKYEGYTLLSTLPVSKSSLVISKYLLVLLIVGLATIYTLTLQLWINNLSGTAVSTILGTTAVTLIVNGFLLLLSYKYGATRAITYFRIIVLSLFLIPWLLQISLLPGEELILWASSLQASVMTILILSLIVYGVLMLISINTFERRMS